MARFWLPLLLIVAASFGGQETLVRDEKRNFEIRRPAAWERVRGSGVQFRTEGVVVFLTVSTGSPTTPLAKIAEQWRPHLEAPVPKVTKRTTGEAVLGGDKCHIVEVWGKEGESRQHLTWLLARRGDQLYTLQILRSGDAIGDKAIEADIEEIRQSFRFLREVPQSRVLPTEDPKELEAGTIRDEFWRFECVKPEGLARIKDEDFAWVEKSRNLMVKMDRIAVGSRCMIRIYAHPLRGPTVKQMADDLVATFEKDFPEDRRKAVERDRKWKVPLGRKTIHLKLTSLGKTKIIQHWYLAECRNQRKYMVGIYTSGGRDWSKQTDAFLKSFRPFKKKK
jgi:hypothetical protein